MPAREEVDAELSRARERGLLRLAGDERAVALVRSLDQARSAAAGDDRDPLDAFRSLRKDHGRAACRLLEPLRELADRHGLVEARAGADARELALARGAEQVREERVVADLCVSVECEVVRDQRQ